MVKNLDFTRQNEADIPLNGQLTTIDVHVVLSGTETEDLAKRTLNRYNWTSDARSAWKHIEQHVQKCQ